MITLFSALVGFLSSLAPDLLKMWGGQQDRQHEITLLRMQLEQQAMGQSQRLEEIRVQSEGVQSQALYKTYATGIHWVDALNGTVRPTLAYAFFLLYFGVKCMQFSLLPEMPLPWQIDALWGEEDRAIFAGIIAFYYGQRAMGKLRGR
jgi:hypothetical protein